MVVMLVGLLTGLVEYPDRQLFGADRAVHPFEVAVDQDGELVLVAFLAGIDIDILMVMPADHKVHAGIVQDRKDIVAEPLLGVPGGDMGDGGDMNQDYLPWDRSELRVLDGLFQPLKLLGTVGIVGGSPRIFVARVGFVLASVQDQEGAWTLAEGKIKLSRRRIEDLWNPVEFPAAALVVAPDIDGRNLFQQVRGRAEGVFHHGVQAVDIGDYVAVHHEEIQLLRLQGGGQLLEAGVVRMDIIDYAETALGSLGVQGLDIMDKAAHIAVRTPCRPIRGTVVDDFPAGDAVEIGGPGFKAGDSDFMHGPACTAAGYGFVETLPLTVVEGRSVLRCNLDIGQRGVIGLEDHGETGLGHILDPWTILDAGPVLLGKAEAADEKGQGDCE